ncbi:MAG: hypothetical protein DHS20C09_11360 [marine bacterium B5-7]|nr:MAG: hypothetical protein DHS20C09_11360 [marine bacterium B5-7]
MVHAIVYAIFNNIFKYILKMPTKLVERDGQETIKIFDTIYADLINLTALIIIIGLSYLTYEYVEKPWRDKFRELSK